MRPLQRVFLFDPGSFGRYFGAEFCQQDHSVGVFVLSYSGSKEDFNERLAVFRSMLSQGVPRLATALALSLFMYSGISEAANRYRTCGAEPTNDFVAYGDLMECELSGITGTDEFRFSGVAGEVVFVQVAELVASRGISFDLIRPDGSSLEANVFNAVVARRISTLDQSGQYRIRVALGGIQSVVKPYALVVDRLSPASPVASPLDPGMSVSGILSPLGDIDFFTFDGETGDVVTLALSETSGTSASIHLSVIDPDGISYYYADGAEQVVPTFPPLSKTGIYSVLVYERDGDYAPDMTYDLSYSCTGVCRSLDFTKRYIDTASIEGINDNGAPESVALFKSLNLDQTRLLVEDSDDWSTIASIPVFGAASEPMALAALGDSTGDTVSELGILGMNLSTGAVVVWTVDPLLATTVSIRQYFDSGYLPVGFSKVEDLNGDRIADVGVMAIQKATGRTMLKIRDSLTGAVLRVRMMPK